MARSLARRSIGRPDSSVGRPADSDLASGSGDDSSGTFGWYSRGRGTMGQWPTTCARGSANRSVTGSSVPTPSRRAELFDTDEPGWFADDAPIRRVHADASMFIGGLRALLFQSLHPVPWPVSPSTPTIAAIPGAGFSGRPTSWRPPRSGRHRRPSEPSTGPSGAPPVVGTAGGEPYAANDPHLLEWVHIAEIDSFLAAHDRYGETAARRRPRPVRRRHRRRGAGARRDRSPRDRGGVCVSVSPSSGPNCAARGRREGLRVSAAATPDATRRTRAVRSDRRRRRRADAPWTRSPAPAVAARVRGGRVPSAGDIVTRTLRWATPLPALVRSDPCKLVTMCLACIWGQPIPSWP